MPEDNNLHIHPPALYYADTPLNIYIRISIQVNRPKINFGNLKTWIKSQF
jgi:hypothetical protein